jgi:hypothetical protein
MSDLIAKDIVDLQDIEKIQFLQTLQSDPAQYSAYVAGKTGRIMSEVVDTKRASFVKVAGDMARQMDMDHNSRAALMRTNDLDGVQGQIVQQQQAQVNSVRYNDDLTRRQVEINNWYYENKRETLFVLQLVLLVMLFATIILTVAAQGFIGEAASDYLLMFVIVIGGSVWAYRWYFTKNVRDPVFWNRRKFSQDGAFAPPAAEICIGGDGETRPTGPAQ